VIFVRTQRKKSTNFSEEKLQFNNAFLNNTRPKYKKSTVPKKALIKRFKPNKKNQHFPLPNSATFIPSGWCERIRPFAGAPMSSFVRRGGNVTIPGAKWSHLIEIASRRLCSLKIDFY
jgi:hypothetical protein